MIIRKMTASFGRLNHETLELHEGLNILSAPNESGKSTWAEFLLAMLYGVDTSQRQKAGGPIPVKERCRPWSGAPMEGTVELEQNGRRITLERTSAGKAPMSVFRAYDTQTGQSVESLHGTDCGQQLLGVPRSVFERSAFIRQCDLPVSGDAALEQRLSALVTTGEADCASSVVEKQLRDLKNRCSRSRTGLIWQAQTELDEIQGALNELSQVQGQISELQAKKEELKQRQTELEKANQALQALDAQQKQEQLRRCEQACRAAAEKCATLEQGCARLPAPEILKELSGRLNTLQEQIQTAAMDAAISTQEVAQPTPPPVFQGKTPEQAAGQAGEDRARYDALTAPRQAQRPVLFILGLLLMALGVGCCCLIGLWGTPALLGLLPATGGGVCLLLWRYRKQALEKKAQDDARQAQQLLAQYGVSAPEEMQALAAAYGRDIERYTAEKQAAQAQKAASRRRMEELEQTQRTLFAQIAGFSADSGSFSACRKAVDTALQAHQALQSAQREFTQAEQQRQAVAQAIGQLQDMPMADAAAYAGLDPAQVRFRLSQCSADLQSVRLELERYRGSLSHLGDRMVLEAKKEALQERLAALRQTDQAIDLATEALQQANASLQERFSPLLCRQAGEIFSQLTNGKYERLLLDKKLTASAQETGQNILRPALALSCGTVDQLYLAVRLAISRLLLPEDAPLVLDDALMAFDDERTALALQVLRKEAQTRQILLFTCHRRELEL